MCRYLASQTGSVVKPPDYRMDPKFPYPYAISDCSDILGWAKKYQKELNPRPRRLIIGGSSVDGNLSEALKLKARDMGVDMQTQVINIPNITHPKFFPRERYRYESTRKFGISSVLSTGEMTWFWGTYCRVRYISLTFFLQTQLTTLSWTDTPQPIP
ncbi:hypothetical protein P154DRAFT_569314 [Amniculicola lignicola CBS 123094]|uniref:Alpha/beta hydrolase fold-3 domain-containing protein n=1 Tax=Amniculicola lignicola CBS 123094 TaxID=1392246 RepID=A0A6A5X3I6_9PLEO|nr:hypothetical protein P154DRAFT_569314 [Amniculicola lignicola CBS 123094]